MEDETLLKYIKNQLGNREKRLVAEWINTSDENQEQYNMLKAKYTASGFNDPLLDVDRTYTKIRERKRRQKLKNGVLKWIPVAGVLVIGWLAYDFLNSQKIAKDEIISDIEMRIVEESTPKGISREIMLPDGTKVVLNVDSKLRYSGTFQDSLREVFLTGEAYFEVKKDVSRPFVVHAGDMNVKVLGTSFSVRSYSEDEDTRTTLVDGVVEIESAYGVPVKLKPLQTASLDKEDKRIEIKRVSAEEAVSWKEGKLIFRETLMEDVLEDLERRYDVKFDIQSEVLYDYLYTGTFDNLTIDEVLKVLKISSPIEYKRENEKIILY
ncbi:FecR family protein [Sinomicrobium sp. M5D2P17]